jgi:hypothetical protein
MRKEDLVVLCYATNECYTNVVPLNEDEQKIKVDTEKGLWSLLEGRRDCYGKAYFKIGYDMKHCNWDSREGIIGVYDKTDIEHLGHMVYHSREATYDERSVTCDE